MVATKPSDAACVPPTLYEPFTASPFSRVSERTNFGSFRMFGTSGLGGAKVVQHDAPTFASLPYPHDQTGQNIERVIR